MCWLELECAARDGARPTHCSKLLRSISPRVSRWTNWVAAPRDGPDASRHPAPSGCGTRRLRQSTECNSSVSAWVLKFFYHCKKTLHVSLSPSEYGDMAISERVPEISIAISLRREVALARLVEILPQCREISSVQIGLHASTVHRKHAETADCVSNCSSGRTLLSLPFSWQYNLSPLSRKSRKIRRQSMSANEDVELVFARAKINGTECQMRPRVDVSAPTR